MQRYKEKKREAEQMKNKERFALEREEADLRDIFGIRQRGDTNPN